MKQYTPTEYKTMANLLLASNSELVDEETLLILTEIGVRKWKVDSSKLRQALIDDVEGK